MDFTTILGLIQRNTNTQNTTTSSYPTADKTTDVNSALNNYFMLANSASGNWRPADDTNQTDYPVIKKNLVANQQDYSFNTDSNGNQILDIYKVRVLNANGTDWTTLEQINQDTVTDDQLSTVNSGLPQQYYLIANGIFLVQKPNAEVAANAESLEVWINRTPTYFTANDTTKKAGLPWVHHEYLALRPSYFYCLAKGLPQANAYKVSLDMMEIAIQKYWRDRNKDYSQAITSAPINSI